MISDVIGNNIANGITTRGPHNTFKKVSFTKGSAGDYGSGISLFYTAKFNQVENFTLIGLEPVYV